MKHRIPFLLTTFRLLLGPIALGLALMNAPRIAFLPILITGTLSDIFDGVLARRYQVATPFLRRYDSITDTIYYLFLLAGVWKYSRAILVQTRWAIAAIAVSELACLAVSLMRFQKYPATHTYLAKLYGISLPGGILALLVFNATQWVVISIASVALLANIEIFAIHLIITEPPVDVLSIFELPTRAATSAPD